MRPLLLPGWASRRDIALLIVALAITALTAVLAPFVGDEQLVNVALLYLLVVLVAAAVWGYVVGLFTAVLANLAVNFFFVPPLHTFTVQEPDNIASLLVFFTVAVVGASMLALLQGQAAEAIAGRTEASILMQVSRAVARAETPQTALDVLCATVTTALGLDGCAILQDRDGWRVVGSTSSAVDRAPVADIEVASAQRAVDSGSISELPDSERIFVPLAAEGGRGVLRLVGRVHLPRQVDREQLLTAVASEAGIALHRAELAVEAQRAEVLQRTDDFKSTLLSTVSHDLRSPLTAIKAAVGSLRDTDVEWTSEDVHGFLETIESQTDRLTALVSNLLEMSRLEGGAAKVRLEPVQVDMLLNDVIAACRTRTGDRRMTVEARPSLWVRSDYGLMMQALGNLVENAARYSVPRGTIRLTAALMEPSAVAIRVMDEGPGIPAEDLPHVFEKFYRGVQGRRSTGTGLGLAIVRAMVELCGGTISVRSSYEGTVFTIVLPAVEAPA